ncbi:hypothetical protein [Mesorhizobium sp. L-8-3]|uniref:hypothetical protein n=1 Tax=Mesorhizobium sp. L-8-3 TaxID=2744522 RepID=UPI0019280E3C|nr:hypothetical protein [Mesorhizobium sp. L-8-3]BCH27466.1 hypothetical protein MesoLjLb_72510 [Mesorhizobium sp. L-8-3]
MPIRISTARRNAHHDTGWLRRLAARFLRPCRTLLDPRSLPDHLKRDMGFLDGNGPNVKGQ